MRQTVSTIGEFGLIEHFKRTLKPEGAGILGIGDDTAVLPHDSKSFLLFTTDLLAEGVHFDKSTCSAREIGRKALAVNISDIAAMGGIPTFATVSFAVPPKTGLKFVRDVYSGLKKIARKFEVEIVGGDTSSAEKIFISVALLGIVEKKNLVLRSGARPGDLICVTGSLGGSLSGKHLRFTPRLKEARLLVKRVKPSAMIDISDGLIQDLRHIMESSKAGAELNLSEIPVSREALKKNKGNEIKALECALSDGEDFEILFTVPKKHTEKLKQVSAETKCKIIGVVTGKRGHLELEGEAVTLEKQGYMHFRGKK